MRLAGDPALPRQRLRLWLWRDGAAADELPDMDCLVNSPVDLDPGTVALIAWKATGRDGAPGRWKFAVMPAPRPRLPWYSSYPPGWILGGSAHWAIFHRRYGRWPRLAEYLFAADQMAWGFLLARFVR